MNLSVVIVNYNTCALLRDCLTSLSALPSAPEIIVVDNASKDGSAAMVAEMFPQVRLLAQSVNTWFCGGNNIGIDAATRDYVLLLNPDTVVPPNALETLLAFMESQPHYNGATLQLRYPDGSVQRTCSRVPSYAYLLANHTPLGMLAPRWKAALNRAHWYADEGFDGTQSRDVQVLPGSCLLMRRAQLRLDDTLLLYFPEDDLARRFGAQPFRFIADAHIIHREKSATRSWLASVVYFRDMLRYTRKHHGAAHTALLWALSRPLWLAMWLRAHWLR